MLRKCKKQFKTKTSIGEMSQINLLAILAQYKIIPTQANLKLTTNQPQIITNKNTNTHE